MRRGGAREESSKFHLRSGSLCDQLPSLNPSMNLHGIYPAYTYCGVAMHMLLGHSGMVQKLLLLLLT